MPAATRHRFPALLIVARNLRHAAHSVGPVALRGALIAALFLSLVLATWNRTRASATGRDLLAWFDHTNLWLLWLCGILLFPSVIAEEREQHTWPLLRLAGVGPGAFLLGQSASLLVLALLAILVQVPFLILAVALGGATVATVGGSVAVLMAHAVAVYGVAMLASARARSVRAATLWALLLVPSVSFLPDVLRWLLGGRLLAEVVAFLPSHLLSVLRAQALPTAELLRAVAVHLAIGVVAMLAAWLLFSSRDAEHQGRIAPEGRTADGASRAPRFRAGIAAVRMVSQRLATGGPRTWLALAALYLLVFSITKNAKGSRSNMINLLLWQGLMVTLVGTLMGAWSVRSHLVQRTIPLLTITHGNSTRWLTAIRHARWQTLAVLFAFLCTTWMAGMPSGDQRETSSFLLLVAGAAMLGDAVGENLALRGTRAPWAIAVIVMAGVAALMIAGGFLFRPRSATGYFSTHGLIYLAIAFNVRNSVALRWRYPG
ncbi:MAG: hypothetical protein R3F56_23185 [Planctomycetota bacterium]